ncbi:MAG TPA: Calx-beta domain-containing protein, partial [Pyrinomonadaceae bacterium]|nr:Calx-beta domain-containing protein [Pyrinomonadaceae bacterium]
MKKGVLTLAVAIFAAASVGSLAFKVSSAALGSRPDDKDPELAATIRRMTNRSMAGLTKKRSPKGDIFLDLQGRFQDLALVKLDPEGDPAVGCVSGIGEANRFFGRNLETGEIYSFSPTDTEEYLRTKHAAPTDMTMEEFLRYKEMIRRAAPRLLGGGGSYTNSVTGTHSLASDLATNTTVITIANNDGAGEGFNDATAATPEGGNNGATLGAQRLNVFNFAGAIWAANVDSTVPIIVRAQFDPLTPCSSSGGLLGQAGSPSFRANFGGAEFTDTWYPVALANKLAGTDLNGTNPEINATFNSSIDTGCLGTGRTFYYGLDNLSPGSRVNLLVVLLHELGHGMGFATITDGSTGVQAQGLPDIFSRHIYDRSTNKFWNQMTDTERQTSALNNGNLLWDGANVDLASVFLTLGRDTSNGRVQLYAPAAYESGSSVSHWDKPATPNLLMEPVINRGLPTDLDLTRQQMRDIGWYRDVNGDRIPDTISNVTVSGTNLQVGSSAQVTWVNGGGFAGNVTVELSTDGGATYSTALATNVANTGSLTFTVPNNPTSQGRIRVREYDFVSPAGINTGVFTIGATAGPTSVAFSTSSFAVGEGGGLIDVAVVRTGDTSGTTSVGYNTLDKPLAGHATQSSDYEISVGSLTFAPGEASKTFRILIVDDHLVEGNE